MPEVPEDVQSKAPGCPAPEAGAATNGRRLEPKVIEGEPLTASEEAWCEFGIREEQRAVDACRDAAKAIMQAMGIVLPGYFAALVAIFGTAIPGYLVRPLWWWGPALFLAFVVLLPWPWRAGKDCPDEIRDVFKKMAWCKWCLVVISAACVCVGMALVAVGR